MYCGGAGVASDTQTPIPMETHINKKPIPSGETPNNQPLCVPPLPNLKATPAKACQHFPKLIFLTFKDCGEKRNEKHEM